MLTHDPENSDLSLHDEGNDSSILDAINNMPAEEALSLLNDYLEKNPDDDEALTQRGLKHWKLNHTKEAINDYLAAIKINPESKARTALEFANSILSYYNKDLLNP